MADPINIMTAYFIYIQPKFEYFMGWSCFSENQKKTVRKTRLLEKLFASGTKKFYNKKKKKKKTVRKKYWKLYNFAWAYCAVCIL